jgi:hypothetical protein
MPLLFVLQCISLQHLRCLSTYFAGAILANCALVLLVSLYFMASTTYGVTIFAIFRCAFFPSLIFDSPLCWPRSDSTPRAFSFCISRSTFVSVKPSVWNMLHLRAANCKVVYDQPSQNSKTRFDLFRSHQLDISACQSYTFVSGLIY